MTFKKIQEVVLNKLLDKYEKSKTFIGTNQINQNFGKKISEIFSKYNDDAEYDLFCDINLKHCSIFLLYMREAILLIWSL